MVGVSLQSDQGPHLIAGPICHNHRLQPICGHNLLVGWLFVIKQIGRRSAQSQFSQIVDDVDLFKATFKLGLKTGERRAELAVHIYAAGEKIILVQIIKALRKNFSIRYDPVASLRLIGLRGTQRGPDRIAHPFRKPPLQRLIDRKHSKYGDQNRWEQRNHPEGRREAEMQPRACRLRPAGGRQLDNSADQQCCDKQNINKISGQNKP